MPGRCFSGWSPVSPLKAAHARPAPATSATATPAETRPRTPRRPRRAGGTGAEASSTSAGATAHGSPPGVTSSGLEARRPDRRGREVRRRSRTAARGPGIGRPERDRRGTGGGPSDEGNGAVGWSSLMRAPPGSDPGLPGGAILGERRAGRGGHTRQLGPSSALRSPNSAGVGVTRSPSSSRITVVRPVWVRRRWTSVGPGWVASTSLSRSTTGGVQRVDGQRHDHRAAGALVEVGDRELGGVDRRDVVPAVDPAAHDDHQVLGEHVRHGLVGLREEEDLDGAVEVLDGRRSPRGCRSWSSCAGAS